MDSSSLCRCCLARPPDKELETLYTCLGKKEIYADMLKDCFEIHLSIEPSAKDNGICELCVTRLRDAYDFKHQVVRCQNEFQLKLSSDVNEDEMLKVKEEMSEDGDRDVFFFDMNNDVIPAIDTEQKLAEILGLKDVTIKRKKKHKKHIDDDDDHDNLPLKILRKMKKDDPSLPDNAKHVYNVKKILKYSNCTPFFSKTLSGIVCASCKTTCPNLIELRSHIKEKHPKIHLGDKRLDKSNLALKMDITDLKCKICSKNVHNITNLKKHLFTEHNEKFFPDIYDYIFEFKITDGDILNCALCNSTFETFKMLLQHMNGHYRNYICEVCDMGFINKHRLNNHKRTHDVGSFKCSFCDKVFSTKVRKKCHEKYTHNSSARYTTVCPHCDKTFNSYYQRNRHMFDEHNISAATYKCIILAPNPQD